MAAEGPAAGLPPREPTRRLFFALWPDEAMRQAMAQSIRKAVRASGGRPVPAQNLHVTLAFLGSIPERRMPELSEIARTASGHACETEDLPESSVELVFDHLEYWRAAQLLCALPAETPTRIAELARDLQELLTRGGFVPDLKPFRPHVTVVRKVSRPGRIEKMHPVVWSFTELALVESRTLPEGALYSAVLESPLVLG